MCFLGEKQIAWKCICSCVFEGHDYLRHIACQPIYQNMESHWSRLSADFFGATRRIIFLLSTDCMNRDRNIKADYYSTTNHKSRLTFSCIPSNGLVAMLMCLWITWLFLRFHPQVNSCGFTQFEQLFFITFIKICPRFVVTLSPWWCVTLHQVTVRGFLYQTEYIYCIFF